MVDANHKRYLNTGDAGALVRRSPGAMRNLVMRRQIPFRKVGGRLVFLREELEGWIDSAPGVRLEDLDKN